MKSMPYPSTGPSGRGQVANRSSTGAVGEAPPFDPLIGRKVMTRWPEDNNFYEAVITDYNPVEVCLVILVLIFSVLELHIAKLTLFQFSGSSCSGI